MYRKKGHDTINRTSKVRLNQVKHVLWHRPQSFRRRETTTNGAKWAFRCHQEERRKLTASIKGKLGEQ